MEHTRTMAWVDPRLLETLRPPPTDTVGKVLLGLDAEMTSIIDRKDPSDGDKVKLYNQVLQRYNDLTDRRVKAPTRVVVVNEDEPIPAAAAAAAQVEAPRDVDDLGATVPKTVHVKSKKTSRGPVEAS